MSEPTTSYDARIYATETYEGKRAVSYRVRWRVGRRPFRRAFRTKAAAESFRSELVTASRTGEAFNLTSGIPLSKHREDDVPTMTWHEFAGIYADMKWPDASPGHRKSIAECLVTITCALMTKKPKERDARATRSALMNWEFNAARRRDREEDPASVPEEVAQLLDWAARHSRPVTDLTDNAVLRALLAALGRKLDGNDASPRTAALKRTILSNALDYAVELKLLPTNPLNGLKTPKAKAPVGVVDRRAVVNHKQARALLAAVGKTPRTGPELVAFFGLMYYSALRPEEAVPLREADCDLPDPSDPTAWGWLTLERAAPDDRSHWTGTGESRAERQLKHRPAGETRRVPCPPALAQLLRSHLETYGTTKEGRLFRTWDGKHLASSTYARIWSRAREAAFTATQQASPLARRPYDLRHAAVSTWLNGGVPPTQVAEWAGHSVAVLLRVYAKCIDGQETEALRRIDAALEDAPSEEAANTNTDAPTPREAQSSDE